MAPFPHERLRTSHFGFTPIGLRKSQPCRGGPGFSGGGGGGDGPKATTLEERSRFRTAKLVPARASGCPSLGRASAFKSKREPSADQQAGTNCRKGIKGSVCRVGDTGTIHACRYRRNAASWELIVRL